ncbi:MAG: NAD(P)H-dependent oxidoreductase [Rickettsiales bacterium]
MKLLCIAASHRPDSYNRKLIQLATEAYGKHGIEIDAPDYHALDLPPYDDVMRESGNIPERAHIIKDRLSAAQGLLVASPEYNWSYPGSLKNIIDWLSHFRPIPFNGKTAFLMCATPSKRGGALCLSHLKIPLEALGVYVYPEVFTLSEATQAFDASGKITIPKASEQFYQLLESYRQFTQKLMA